jgi:hypothetical protein
MKKITKTLTALLIVGLFFSCKHNNSVTPDEEPKSDPGTQTTTDQKPEEKPPVDEKVEAVTFSVAAGDITEYTTVALTSATADAVIYYAYAEGEAAATLTKENYASAAKYEAPVEIIESGTLYAIAVKGSKVSEITSAAYKAVAPADAMRNWTAESEAKAYSVYKYADLEKLAEVVNGGKDLAGVTITQKKNIKINESVLGEKFAEPEEAEGAEPNASLKNFAGIGSKDKLFAGTYDGDKKVISGLYIYGGQQGLGFFGGLNAATIKNVIILDGCVINKNVWEGLDSKGVASHDGSDDDRFGGLVGITKKGESNIENCLFVGTVGSKVAKERGKAYDEAEKNPYEYIGGIVGRVESDTTANLTNCFSLVKLYGSSAALVKKVSGKANCKDCFGVSLDKKVYKTKDAESAALDAEGGVTKAEIIEAAKTACGIDLTDYFTKAGL